MSADTPEKSYTASASEKNKEKLKKVFSQMTSETPESSQTSESTSAQEQTSQTQEQQPAEDASAKDMPEQNISAEYVLELKREIKMLEERANQEEEKFVREKAEFANRLKRKDLEKEKAVKFAQEKFFKDFLLVLDSVDGALMQNHEQVSVEQLLEGLEMMSQQMASTLKTFGLDLINPEVGEVFSPQTCEAMSMQPTQEQEHNTILAVVQKGYMYQERLLRPARVIVAQNT